MEPPPRGRTAAAVAGLLVALLLAVALAGCTDRSVQKDAVTAFLNSDVDAKAVDCRFPSRDVEEGIVGAPRAVDFSVGPAGRIYVLYTDRLEVVGTDWEVTATWDLPDAGTYTVETLNVHAGPDWVAVSGFPVDGADRGVVTWTPEGQELARRVLENVRGFASTPDGDVVARHDGGTTVLTRALEVVRTFDVDARGTGVRDVARCGDTYYWLDSVDHDASEVSSRVLLTDANGTTTDVWTGFIEPWHLAAGHGMVVIPDASSGGTVRLKVFTADGTELVSLSRDDGTGYGRFDVAHGLVYNLRGDGSHRAILARPIADFLTGPN